MHQLYLCQQHANVCDGTENMILQKKNDSLTNDKNQTCVPVTDPVNLEDLIDKIPRIAANTNLEDAFFYNIPADAQIDGVDGILGE